MLRGSTIQISTGFRLPEFREPMTLAVQYFIARHYSQAIGRFIQPDPLAISEKLLENPQDLNLYSYTINNPLRYADPNGQDWKDVLLGVGEGSANFAVNTVQGLAYAAYATSPVGIVTGANREFAEGVVQSVGTAAAAYANEGVSGVANSVLAQGEQGAVAVVTEAVLTGGLGATARLTGLKSSAPGAQPSVVEASTTALKPIPPGENAAAAAGRTAHAELAAKVKGKPGWQSQPRLTDPKTGNPVRPDVVTPSGRPLEYKPNSPSGRARGRSQLRAQERASKQKGRLIYYDPKKR